MNFEKELSLRNLKRKPARTAALVILTAFLAFSVFGGSLIVMSMQRGLESYKSRLGADIIAVPNESRSKGTVESILLQGIPGYFYMDGSKLEKIREIQGVETASPQFYLASTSSGCCSVAVQIIGFDPESDFLIQPWIKESYSGNIGDGDLVVGSGITVPKNRILTFYDTDCHVAAQLAQTGMGLDNAVYANMNTIKEMMKNAENLGFNYFADVNADNAVSSVMVKVKDGYDIEDVAAEINVHVRRVEATPTKSMISSISDGLSRVSKTIGLLTVVIWVLAFVILLAAFTMIFNERTKEFAVLRVIGAPRKMLFRFIGNESLIIGFSGALIGIGAGAAAVFPFGKAVADKLNLPYLLPDLRLVAAVFIGAVLVSLLAGRISSAAAARKIVGSETGIILRDDV